jgi:hypothetical protein
LTTENKPEFKNIYLIFKAMLSKYIDDKLHLREDGSIRCEVIGPTTPYTHGDAMYFGAARIGKNYVSYYLMPVYAFPDLLDGISPELKRRMQGKSCFNFTHVDEMLFMELEQLTERGYERFKQEGYIISA